MAASKASATFKQILPEGIDRTGNTIRALAVVAITAGDYTPGGITVSLASDTIKSQNGPLFGTLSSYAAGGASGYVYAYKPSSDTAPANASGKIQIFQSAGSAAPLVELGSVATPAAVVADVIVGEFIWQIS